MLSAQHNIRERVLRGDPKVGEDFCKAWLSLVSRTFALNIRVLPEPSRNAVRLAYLFCRIADTVEDDRQMPPPERHKLLEQFSACFAPSGPSDSEIQLFCDSLPKDWKEDVHPDKFLTAHCNLVFREYAKLPQQARQAIDLRVKEMCGGMVRYALLRGENGWFRLSTRRDLLDYCYFVAGTVGLMLCDLFAWQSPRIHGQRLERLRSRAVSFGLGLQLVNIARDVPADWQRKTVFLPEEMCRTHGIDPEQLVDPSRREHASKVLADLMRLAQKELLEAQQYILDLPRTAMGLRLFCLWPLLMAQDTLSLLAKDPSGALDPAKRLKIGRAQVKRILWTTTACFWSNTLLKGLFLARNKLLHHRLREKN